VDVDDLKLECNMLWFKKVANRLRVIRKLDHCETEYSIAIVILKKINK